MAERLAFFCMCRYIYIYLYIYICIHTHIYIYISVHSRSLAGKPHHYYVTKVLASKKFRGCSKLDQFNVEQNLAPVLKRGMGLLSLCSILRSATGRVRALPGPMSLGLFLEECMIAADEYYSKQRLEPPGSRASW